MKERKYMTENKTYRLGDLIELCDERNTEGKYTVDDVRGISNTKEVMPTKADITDRSLETFQVVKPNYFVFNRRTTRMGEKIGLGYNDTGKDFIVTEDYVVFHIKEETKIIPEYLFMFFNRDEFDRYCRWDSWGSATEFFNWENMCFVLIPLPPLAAQQKAAAVYNALKANLAAYEQGLEDLKLVCDGFIEELRKTNTSERIGNYITQKNIRNKDKKITRVMGLSTKKEFREAQSRVNRDELGNYKIVETNDFAFVPTTDTWKVLAFSYNTTSETICVSPIYEVFSTDREKIVPGYLAIWLNRKEFDRYARYNSWGSARENFSFEDMCDVQIPLPPLEVQQSIVNMYKCYTERRRIAAELKAKIKTICPILIKGSLEEM